MAQAKKGTRTIKKQKLPEPLTASFEGSTILSANYAPSSASTGTRRNIAGSIPRTNRFVNIEEGVAPFVFGSGRGKYSSNIAMRDVIILCQKAYWNVPIFRNTIDLMTEFSCSPIYFKGGNKESRDFFNNWAKKIGLWKLTEMFFREYFRSGNVFLYRLYGTFDKSQTKKLENMNLSKAAQMVPYKYLLLNPADIEVIASSNFSSPFYVKILNQFEIQSLLGDGASAEDKQIADSIPELKNLGDLKKGVTTIQIKLDPRRLAFIFYKKQDYEPMSVPMGFPVLEDINWKLELKKMDMAITRTVSQVVLLVTQGSEEREASPENLRLIKNIFENQSVGRVLVADYTTKAEFVIPKIMDILDPQKYAVVDRDIREGLNNVLFGEDKFSNASVKIDVFFERLKQSREEWINWLGTEVERIGKELNFKAIPQPRWKNENLGINPEVLSRVYVRMMELGAISPQDAINAVVDNRLPEPDELAESQQLFLDQKEKGFFTPLLNQSKDAGGETGRPPGISAPKISTKSSPIGKKLTAKFNFGVNKISETLVAKGDLFNKVCTKLRSKYKVTRLKESQKVIAQELTNLIVGSEEKENWSKKIVSYIDNPLQDTLNNIVTKEVFEIAEEHGVSTDEASILYHSKVESCQDH